MSHDDFAFEPIRGLPENLPSGERLIWQGAPSGSALARRAFHVRGLSVYFGLLLVWQASAALMDGKRLAEAAVAAGWLVGLASVALGLMVGLAFLYARTTVYSLTDRRLVIRFGIAIPMSINIPFSLIESAAAKLQGDGTADLPLRLRPGERISYLVLWPNVRPWRFSRPEPMLRAVPDGAQVAELLASALAEAAGQEPVTASLTPANVDPALSPSGSFSAAAR
jgi:hypothetical protein